MGPVITPKSLRTVKTVYFSTGRLDLRKMIEEINELVCTDFALDMEHKFAKEREFTQEEAKTMADLLGRIYMISHSIDCSNCGKRYKLGS